MIKLKSILPLLFELFSSNEDDFELSDKFGRLTDALTLLKRLFMKS